jgi:hypothetical protein
LTIDDVCLGVALLAIDIAVWKQGFTRPWVSMGVRGTLVASSVLAFALVHLLKGRGNRPFLVGFLAAGLVAGLAYWAWCWLAPWQVYADAQSAVDQVVINFFLDRIPGLEHSVLQRSSFTRLFFEMTCFPLIVTIDSLPVLSVAVLGGWVWRKRAARDLLHRPVIT